MAGSARLKRRPLTKAELAARLPRFLRPKLEADQVRDLAMCHVLALDDIARGRGDEERLWDWVGGVLTWHQVAHRLGVLTSEMTEVGEMTNRLVERFRETGRVVFTGPDYELAKVAVEVMDRLAELTDQPTAAEAAEWSERVTRGMADQAERERQPMAARAA